MSLPKIRPLALALTLTLCACAGHDLRPGTATEADARQQLGSPAMQWEWPDGGKQLAFPRGPMGYQTYMVFIDAAGRVERSGNVLTTEGFATIQPGMTQAAVLQQIGPPQPQWDIYFAARNELVWEWRYCNAWSEPARFNVLFDGSSLLVRSTLAQSESLRGYRREKC
jgi:hypothetical protein